MEANNILSMFPDFQKQFRSFNIVDRQETLNQPNRLIRFTEGFQLQAQLLWVKTQNAIKKLDSSGISLAELVNPATEEVEVIDRNLPRTGSYLLAGLTTVECPADTNLLQVSLYKLEQALTDSGFTIDDLNSLRVLLQRRHPLAEEYNVK